MYAHATVFKVGTDRWDRANGTLGPAKAEIAAIPGLRLWLTVGSKESGEGVAVAVFEDNASQARGLNEIEQVLSGFAETLVTPWHVIDGEVLAFADNDWQDLINTK